jgi:Hypothetical glycosyl hydrolase family 15
MTSPPSRSATAFLAALVLAAALVTIAAGAPLGAKRDAVHRGIAVFRTGDSYRQGSGYGRYDFLVIGYGDVQAATRTGARVLVYKTSSEVKPSPNADRGAADSGVPYAQAAAHGWLLKDASGKDVQVTGEDWLGDVGSREFQQAWLDNVSGWLRRQHAAGVFVDNVVCTLSDLTGGHYPAKYPSPAAWADAQASFMAYVGSRMKAMGLYVAINAYCEGPDSGSANNAWWARLAPSVSAESTEYFEQNPNNPAQQYYDSPATSWLGNWLGKLNVIRVAEQRGKDAFAITAGTHDNTMLMTYARASYLLVWNGRSGGFIYAPTDGSDPWNAAWTTPIGKPLRSMQRTGSVYFRRYTRGYVVVNPSLSAAAVALPPGLKTPAGAPAGRSVQLAPTTAAIFRRS